MTDQRQQRVGVLPGFPGSADLGGLPLMDGGTTVLGRVIRFGVPRPPEVAHREAAERCGVVAVVDLRSAEEAGPFRHPLAGTRGYRWLPLIDPEAEALRDVTSEATFGELYSRSLERNRRTLAAVFSALAEHASAARAGRTSGAVLVCCAAGRDRTGMVAALLLDLARAERVAVVEDYHRAGSGAPVVDPPRAPAPRRLGGPDVETMLRHVDERWDGPAAYLRWLGLPDQQVVALKSLLRAEQRA